MGNDVRQMMEISESWFGLAVMQNSRFWGDIVNDITPVFYPPSTTHEFRFRRQVLPLDQSEVWIPDCLSVKNCDLYFLVALLLNS